MVNER